MTPMMVISILATCIALLLALTALRQLSDRLAKKEKRPFAFAIGAGLALGNIAVVGLSFYPNLLECWPQHHAACIWTAHPTSR